MHHVNAPAALLPHVFGEISLRRVFFFSRRGDGEQPVRLDDDDDVVVFMQKRQRRRQRDRFCARQHCDVVPCDERTLRIDLRLAVDANTPGLQHLAKRRAR